MEPVLKTVRKFVSRDRIRFQSDGYDLDLAYITDKILAMSFPSTGLTSVWRNHIDEVHRLLKTRHEGAFMIWNLSEHKYNYDKFDNMTLDFPFPDHHAPPLTLMFGIVNSIDSWLQALPQNVAVVHCKGGKGRTGLVIVAWLFYSGEYASIEEASLLFARKRSSTAKGVTQASQLRYLSYFSDLMLSDSVLVQRPLMLLSVRLDGVPEDLELCIEVIWHKQNDSKTILCIPDLRPANVEDGFGVIEVRPESTRMVDDIIIRATRGVKGTRKEVFHLIFNTYFVTPMTPCLRFPKKQLDNPRKMLPEDFAVTLRVVPVLDEKPAPFEAAPLINQMRATLRRRHNMRPRAVPDTAARRRGPRISASSHRSVCLTKGFNVGDMRASMPAEHQSSPRLHCDTLMSQDHSSSSPCGASAARDSAPQQQQQQLPECARSPVSCDSSGVSSPEPARSPAPVPACVEPSANPAHFLAASPQQQQQRLLRRESLAPEMARARALTRSYSGTDVRAPGHQRMLTGSTMAGPSVVVAPPPPPPPLPPSTPPPALPSSPAPRAPRTNSGSMPHIERTEELLAEILNGGVSGTGSGVSSPLACQASPAPEPVPSPDAIISQIDGEVQRSAF
eukprot:m51a1_g4302 putative phosphatase tensin type domain-containing protein (618) ;mRNA; r:14814-17662